jgi:hypothetical protein
MRPPAEQLIRDYLNRLSVAARNRLPPEDRRAFLVRTNDFIERQSGVRGTADPAEVMRILSGIGEPETVVERERARLEARRSEREAAAGRVALWKPRRQGSGPDEAGGAEPDGPKLTNKDGRPLTGEIKVTSRPITSRWRPGEALKPRPTRASRIPKPRPGRPARGATDSPTSGPQAAGGSAVPPGPAGAGTADAGGAGAGGAGAGSAGAGGAAPAGAGGPDVAAPGASDGSAMAGSGGSGGAGAAPTGSARAPWAGPGGAGGAATAGSGGAAPAASRNGVPAGSNGASSVRREPPVIGASPGAPSLAAGPQAAPPGTAPLAPEPGSGVPAPPRPAGRTIRIAPGRTMRIARVPRPVRVPRPATRRRRQRLQPGDVTREIARRAADVGRNHRLETASVVLMVVAGVMYLFPIWLVGFLIWLLAVGLVMMSSVWSLPDKWVGIVGPPMLVIIGTATAISAGGKLATFHDYVDEVLTDSRYLISAGALLGAGYLAWRLQRGRRPPMVPPWLRRNSR